MGPPWLHGCKIFFHLHVCSLPFLGTARDPKSRGVWWKHEKTKHETLLLRGREERVGVPHHDTWGREEKIPRCKEDSLHP
jgi:hypothetical protein